MKIFHVVLGPVQTNVYIVVHEETGACLLIDPADEPELLIRELDRRAYKPAAILLTHGHYDHVQAVPMLRENYGIPVLAMEAERALLADANINHSAMHGCDITLAADRWLQDGETLELAGFSLQAIHTPGHTAGGACYYFPEEQVLFSGDTLFHRSVGRSDLPTGDGETLIRSIKDKLLTLPDDVTVYPGHGAATTIGSERTGNYFLL